MSTGHVTTEDRVVFVVLASLIPYHKRACTLQGVTEEPGRR